MWEKLAGWAQFIWEAGRQTRDNSEEIRRLKEENLRLVSALHTLSDQHERLRDEIRHEREIRESNLRELRLELRLQLSEELRRLPPAQDK